MQWDVAAQQFPFWTVEHFGQWLEVKRWTPKPDEYSPEMVGHARNGDSKKNKFQCEPVPLCIVTILTSSFETSTKTNRCSWLSSILLREGPLEISPQFSSFSRGLHPAILKVFFVFGHTRHGQCSGCHYVCQCGPLPLRCLIAYCSLAWTGQIFSRPKGRG